MSLSADEVLRATLKRVTLVYIKTLARACYRFEKNVADSAKFNEILFTYSEIIGPAYGDICREAAEGISSYLNLYNVRAEESADEYKVIYYLGMAIFKRLQHAKADEAAKIHLFGMIGMLDFRLLDIGVDKPPLRRALMELVRYNRFESELGATGCYLIYKCVSTVDRDAPPPAPAVT